MKATLPSLTSHHFTISYLTTYHMQRNTLNRVIPLALLLGTWVFLVLSLGSFSPNDWPSHAVTPHPPTANLCGPVGAFVAYHGFAMLGAGVWVLMGLGTVLLGLRLWGTKLTDPWLRVAGIMLLAVGVAAISAHVTGFSPAGFPEGSGGVVGIYANAELTERFAGVGTKLILAVVVFIALLLAADEIFTRGPIPALVTAVTGKKLRVPTLPKLSLPKFRMPALPSLPKREKKVRQPKVLEVEDGEDLVDEYEEEEDDEQYEEEWEEDDEEAVDEIDEADIEDAEDEIAEANAEAAKANFDEEEPEQRKDIVVRLANRPKKNTAPPPPKELGDYDLPPWDVLEEAETGFAEQQEEFVRAKAASLEAALDEFGVDARVCAIDTGPVITMYELELTRGTKVSAITGLQNDIARALAAESIRIVAPIPGKHTVGIEVPNAEKEKVRLKDLMQTAPAKVQKMQIPLFLGKDASGEPLITDLASMPHCLIAGTTGSGKSVCINTIIMSIMYTQRPDLVKLILVDPKVVEMAPFRDIPHLMAPVITEVGKAASVLDWACTKMDQRYDLLAEAGVRNIASYNSLSREELIERFNCTTPEEEAKVPKKLPYVVIVIDELADLMMTAGKEVEASIVRIAQKARAVGIHLILATQRPQATVVTGLIKSNMPSKIAFRVSSRMDSRIVLDQNGAELLLGQGDMLFMPPGASRPMRSQGTFIDDMEIRQSVKAVKANAEAQYEPELVAIKSGNIDAGGEKDELFDDAVRVVLETKRGSVSLLQRKLTIGYSRASRLIEQMAESGIVGEYKGSQAREATITLEEWEAMKAQAEADEESGMSV
ncbi:MAG: DNA translocase FtsK [Planctomycetota bacterium]